MRNDVANAAIWHGGENESRILDTVSAESASVSVAQNDLSLPQALCSSTASTGDFDQWFTLFVFAHGRAPYLRFVVPVQQQKYPSLAIFSEHRLLRFRKI